MRFSQLLAGPLSNDTLQQACQSIREELDITHVLTGLVVENQNQFQPVFSFCGETSTLDCGSELQSQVVQCSHDFDHGMGVLPLQHAPELLSLLNAEITDSVLYICLVNSDDNSLKWVLLLKPKQPNTNASLPQNILLECCQLLLEAMPGFWEQQQLLAETAQLSSVVNISDSIYATWHEKAGWQYHNINGFIKLGFDPKDFDVSLIQKNNPMHPEDWQASLQKFKDLLQKGISYQHDYRAVGLNNEILWYHAKTTLAEKNSYGGAKMFTSVSRDITGSKQAEQKAIKALQLEQWLADQTHRIYQGQNFEGFVPALKALSEYLNLKRCSIRIVDPETKLFNLVAEWHEPSLTSLAELFPDLTSQTGYGWVEALVEYGDATIVNNIEIDEPSRKLRNYYRAISCHALISQPMIADGKLIGYLATLNESPRKWTADEIHLTKVIADAFHITITRNRLLDELRESEARMQLAMVNSTYRLWDHDLTKNTFFTSPHFYTSLGYEEKEIPPTYAAFLDLLHPEDRKRVLNLNDNLQFINEGIINEELRMRKKDGSYSWSLGKGRVVKWSKNKTPLQVMGINVDINQYKETLEELNKTRQKAEKANLSKSEFLERMSHEIRTPMNAILGMSYLALDSELNREQRSNLEDIESAAKSLLHVIDDILDFNKIESGELDFIEKDFDLHETVHKILKLFAVRAVESDNQIKVVIADDIPQYVIGDANRVSQVITNLVSNAVKFTRHGSIEISLQKAEVDEKKDTVNILFSVSDSGIGLTPDQQKTLFQPFTQAEESTSRKFGGTGLGLSICKHLVERMGGSIHAISLANVGTTFHFTIVFKQFHASDVELPIDPNVENIFTQNQIDVFQNKRVLLTEDNIVNQRVATGIMHKFGIEVVTANNGQEALFILQASNPKDFDAILMDIEMPILDGIETTKKIRTLKKFDNIPIVAMTAHAMLGDKERCIEAGMNEYIPKPINPNIIQDVLKKIWLARSDQRA